MTSSGAPASSTLPTAASCCHRGRTTSGRCPSSTPMRRSTATSPSSASSPSSSPPDPPNLMASVEPPAYGEHRRWVMLERMARPLRGLSNGIASVMDAVYRPLGRPGKLLQDFLNGSWLGHSLHAVLVDVVIGAATAALLLDLLRVVFGVEGLETATTWVVGLAWLSGVGSIVTGLTDFKDTAPGSAVRDTAILHGLINILATAAFLVSLVMRLGDGHDAGFWLLLIGYVIVSVGGYVGGHIVFKYGYMVNYNAFSRGKRAKEFTAVLPL